jgi:hypothetical protein
MIRKINAVTKLITAIRHNPCPVTNSMTAKLPLMAAAIHVVMLRTRRLRKTLSNKCALRTVGWSRRRGCASQ